MSINPIVKKEVKVQARSMRICWEIFAYEAIMAAVFFYAMLVFEQQAPYSSSNLYSSIVWLYPVLAVTQLLILGVVVPIRTASAISGEKERQTFDIMMTTSMSPFSVIWGKVLTAIIQSMFFVVAGLPVMALAFVIGGLAWSNLFYFLGIAVLVSFFCASIGILCSSLCRKTITAVILSYSFYVLFFVGTFLGSLTGIILHTNGGTGTGPVLFLLLNPAMYLIEFFTWSMAGTSGVEAMLTSGTVIFGSGTAGGIHYAWMAVSTVLFLGISFLFLLLATRRINPLSGQKRQHIWGKNHG